MSKGTTSQDAPFGTLLGYAPGGVAIYSSDYSSLDPQEYEDDAVFRSYIDDEYMGHNRPRAQELHELAHSMEDEPAQLIHDAILDFNLGYDKLDEALKLMKGE